MRDLAVGQAGESRWNRSVALNYNLVFSYIKDKMEVEYFYFCLSLFFSPGLSNALLLLIQVAGGCVTLAVPGTPVLRRWQQALQLGLKSMC